MPLNPTNQYFSHLVANYDGSVTPQFPAGDKPLPDAGLVISSVTIADGVGTITGSGFGTKDPIILYDTVDECYEHGVLNDYFAGFTDGQALTMGDRLDPDCPWGDGNVDSGLAMQIVINDPLKRYGGKTRNYYGPSYKSTVGNPKCWPKSGTETFEPQMYFRWWFWQENDTRYYFQNELTNIDEGWNPEPGDRFSIDVGAHWSGVTEVLGRVVFWDQENNIFHAIYDTPGQTNRNRVGGKVVVLDKNNLSAQLSSDVESRGANKFIRCWDSDGTAGTFRLSWTQTATSIITGSGDINAASTTTPAEGKWCSMELFVDLNAQSASTYVDAVLNSTANYPDYMGKSEDHSPTIGLLGLDASVDLLQTLRVDEVYMDRGFKRITLSNSPTLTGIQSGEYPEEVQRYTNWADGSITFDAKLGALDSGEPVYAYYYVSQRAANENGVLVI